MLAVAKKEMLERLASTLPEPERRQQSHGDFDLERWITEYSLPVVREGSWNAGDRKWVLNPCPWNPEHTNQAAYIVQFLNGAIAAGCQHNGCSGNDWRALREMFEPGCYSTNGNTPVTPRDTEQAGPILVQLHTVVREEVHWEWEGRLARGRLTCLMGDPGVGKSWLTLAIASAVTTGALLPGQVNWRDPCKVLMLTAEDGLADTVRPRAEDMGADLSRIKVLTAVRDARGKERYFSLADDLIMLDMALAEGGYSLIIIDPLNAYLGSTLDTHRDAALRSVLGPLANLAEKWGVSILFTLHLTKGRRDRAIYRGQGSIAYSGAARVVLLAGQNPEDPKDRALAWIKGNLSEPMPALGYEIREGQFYWCGDSDLTAEKMLTPDSAGADARAEAETFLREALAGGPVEAEIVREEARERDISDRTLDRAKRALRVKAERRGEPGKKGGGTWFWRLQGIKDAKYSLGVLNQEATHEPHVDHVAEAVGDLNQVGALNPEADERLDNGLKPSDGNLARHAVDLGLPIIDRRSV